MLDDLFAPLHAAMVADIGPTTASRPEPTPAAPKRNRDELRREFDELAFDLRPLLDQLRPEDRYDGDRVRRKLEEIRRLLGDTR